MHCIPLVILCIKSYVHLFCPYAEDYTNQSFLDSSGSTLLLEYYFSNVGVWSFHNQTEK